MKKFIGDLEKITSINTQLQNKLGEITIWINNQNNLFNINNNQDMKKFILLLQSFLCHKYYLDFMKVRPNENSTYDNCMNLILIVLAKICKMNLYNGEITIKYFIEHINNHLECFNYIISFYRLYITSPQLKQCGKNEELYYYLFNLYKRLYFLNIEYEPKNNLKDLKNMLKLKIIKNIHGYNYLQEQKCLSDNYLHLTDRPPTKINSNDINNIVDNYSFNNVKITSGENYLKHNNNIEEGFSQGKLSNNSKTDIANIINSNSKTNILSRTDRKLKNNNTANSNINNNSNKVNNLINTSNNNRQAVAELNNYSSKLINYNNEPNIDTNKIRSTQGLIQNKLVKTKIPTLKFPLDKTQPHQKFSLIRSSHRNDFSKSGDGSSTTTTKNKLFTNKFMEGSSINRHFSQDVLILEPKEKLRELALQLGESCLATDLTYLINQKRDYEIGKYKKKNVNNVSSNNKEQNKDDEKEKRRFNNNSNKIISKRNNFVNSESQSCNKLNNYIEKLNNLNDNNKNNLYSNSENPSNKNVSFSVQNKNDSKRSINNTKNENNISDNIIINNLRDKSNYSIPSICNNNNNNTNSNQCFKNFIKVREILTNFIVSSLKEYSDEELPFLKLDIYTIYLYLLLPSMDNLQNKTEKKKIEIMEQMKFILDKEKDTISYGSFTYIPEKIEINKKKFQLNNSKFNNKINNYILVNSNSMNNAKKNEFNNNMVVKDNKIENKEHNNLKNFNLFESLLSITFEEDNNCPLILKNENEALYEILSIYSNHIEFEIKSSFLYNSFQINLNLSINNLQFVDFTTVSFDMLKNHLDPFIDLLINKLNIILLSTDIYNCYSNNNNIENDDYIMKLLKNQYNIINYYINIAKSKSLTLYVLKLLKEKLIITKGIFVIIFNRLTNLINCNNSNGYNNINNKNSNVTLENNFTERYDFKIPIVLIEAFCSFLQLISNFIIAFDDNNITTLSKFLNENFLSNSDLLNLIKFSFDYLFLSNLNKEYTFMNDNMINNNININNILYQCEKSTSNSQRLGNNFFNKCSLCSILKDDNISKFNDNLSEIYKHRVKLLVIIIHYFYECNVYYQKIISINSKNFGEMNSNLSNSFINNITTPIINSINDDDNMSIKKYWNNSINNYMFYLNMLLNSKSGSVFDFFICSNGGNFLFSKIKLSIIFTHYNLTKNLLILQESALNFPMKSSFIINEMTSLDIIRLHYISFIKLYNKNIIFNTNLSEVSSIIATSENFQQKKTIKAFVKDIHNDQNLLNILINLCKMHLRCLFVLGKNRNADITNKFFQLKIIDYFTHEIQLEQEVAEKIYKLNQFNSSSSNNITTVQKNSIFNDKNKNLMNKLDLANKHNDYKAEEKSKSKNLKNINEVSLEDNCNESDNNVKVSKKNSEEFTEEEEEYEEGEEEEEDEFDEIPLVAPNNNTCSYKNKIPKLNMLSSSYRDNENNNVSSKKETNEVKKNIEEEKKIIPSIPSLKIGGNEDDKKNEKDMKKNNVNVSNNNNDNGPKIKLNLNLGLCKTKSDKNKKLQEEINKKDKEVENKKEIEKKENKIGDNSNNNQGQGQKIQLKLNLDLCKTKSNKNELLKNEIIKNNNINKNNEKINDLSIKNETSENNNTNKTNNNTNSNNKTFLNNSKKIIQLPKLNLKIPLKPNQDNSNNNENTDNLQNNQNNDNISNKETKNLNKDGSLASKIRVEIENHLKEKYKLFYQKALNEPFTENDLNNVNQFYLKERNNRVLYQDPEIQVLIISLIFSLIITPSRGTLEELYCSVFPYENNKLNILFIIHHHLNRQENSHILPLLLKFVSQIHPFGAGQRLLKLLCKNFFDVALYTHWVKIGGGQFGTVYQCNTGLSEPGIVAIKKTEIEQNIFSPCHLFDIFTEVTALETLRLENCVTQLYDYGCDEENYYIVMKRYPISLKKWRIEQKNSLKEMLPTYLSIFKDILQAVQIIHNNNTTHYDLKCDNIVLDFVNSNKENTYDVDMTDDNETDSICIRVADFGECRMFLDEIDEHCTRSRGTDVIKSPEMLKHFGYQIRKEDDNFDRRKKIGTTRSSDIWSLGCLFYELLTGNFLFEEIQDNYLEFMYKIDKSSMNDLLTDKKLSLLDNNPYLVDFLKFMLVKNQTYRPNIDTVIKRFEHVYALLEGGTGAMIHKKDFDLLQYDNKIYNESYFEDSIEKCEDMIDNEDNSWDNTYDKNLLFNNIKLIPELLKLTKDIFIAQYDYIEDPVSYYSNINNNSNNNNLNYNNNGNEKNTNNSGQVNNNKNTYNTNAFNNNSNMLSSSEDCFNLLMSLGITHIISFTNLHKKSIKSKFYFLNLTEENNDNKNNISNNNNKVCKKTPFEFTFEAMDFLRHCMINKGKILFIDDYFYNNIQGKPNCLMRSILLVVFAYFLNQSAYDTYTYLNNKLLFYNLPIIYYLPSISNWIMNQNIIFNYLSSFPIFRCFCGACQLIMRRDFVISKKKICNCLKTDSSIRDNECPSNGCNEYIEFVKKTYNKNYNSLIWGSISLNNFYLKIDSVEEKHYKQIITFSKSLENNIIEHSISEKYSIKNVNSVSSSRKKLWKLFECKTCHCWIFGQCNEEIQVLLNNEYNFSKNIDARKKLVKDNELKDISLQQFI